MVTALRTQITTPNNTHITSPENSESWRAIAGAVSQAMSKLHKAYREAVDCTLGPVVIEQASNEAVEILRANSANTKNKILEGFESIKRGIPGHENPVAAERVTHLCGWLLGFSGILEDPAEWVRLAGLKPEHNPWPNVSSDRVNHAGKALEVEPPPRQIELDTSPPDNGPYDLINADPNSFISNMGDVEGQHFLVIEDLVDGGPAILGILGGCLRSSLNRLATQRRPEKPDITICDLTGKPYLGLETIGKVFYSSVCDRPGTSNLSDEDLWHLPLMEGVWQAHKALKDRLLARKLGDHNVDFPPHFLVLRRWDVILSDWNDMTEARKNSLREAWRHVYDHPEDQYIDIAKAVRSILTLGDDVSVTLVMSITCFGSVEDVGVSKNKLNSFLIVIPGTFGSTNGGKAVQSALSDNRLQFVTPDNRPELRKAMEQGQRFSRDTGNQYCLVNLSGQTDGAMIMTIPTLVMEKGKRTPIESIHYDYVIKRLEPSPQLNG